MNKYASLRKDFENATARLAEGLVLYQQEFVREFGIADSMMESALQRFEFTFDTAWKVLQAELEKDGIVCESPGECIRSAFKVSLIANDPFWLKLIDLRNITSHNYKERLAQNVFLQLPHVLDLFEDLIRRLKAREAEIVVE